MDFNSYLTIDNVIKDAGTKYHKTPRDIKILLLLELNNKQLTSEDFLNKTFITRPNLKPILDKLVHQNCINCDRSKIPFKYSITDKGLSITNDFYKSLKRAQKNLSK